MHACTHEDMRTCTRMYTHPTSTQARRRAGAQARRRAGTQAGRQAGRQAGTHLHREFKDVAFEDVVFHTGSFRGDPTPEIGMGEGFEIDYYEAPYHQTPRPRTPK